MCRLVGYVACEAVAAADVLGESAFANLTALAAIHNDGWGMAWPQSRPDGGSEIVTSRSTQDAVSDARFASLATRALSHAGLVHLRWATDGLSIRPENTHPFLAGQLALAHNGSIQPIAAFDELLSDSAKDAVIGDTDSERYFRFVQQRIEELGDIDAAIIDSVKTLSAQFPGSSLNALLLTDAALYAVNVHQDAVGPELALREMFEREDDIPAGHLDTYFEMFYRVTDDAVVIASNGIGGDDWQPMPAAPVMRVDLATRAISLL